MAGPVVPPQEYARYCRYLVARYGAAPTVYLVGADGAGTEPQIEAGGTEIDHWDGYGQPRGIHYRPDSANSAHQGASWLHFQWCQTGQHGRARPGTGRRHAAQHPAQGGRQRRTHLRELPAAPATPPAGGEDTRPGATSAPAARWAWSTARRGCGSGGCTPTNPATRPSSSPRTRAGARHLDFEGSHHVGRVSRILDGLPSRTCARTGTPPWHPVACPSPASCTSATRRKAAR
ncbi:DUF4038 domain-containing protein [Streptomyces sp. L7]